MKTGLRPRFRMCRLLKPFILSPMFWQTSRFRIDLSVPRVMGIVNITPDSFSDGGRHGELSLALRHCEKLLAEGADILDIGGDWRDLERCTGLARVARQNGAAVQIKVSVCDHLA